MNNTPLRLLKYYIQTPQRYLMIYLSVFFFQVCLSILRTLEIKYTIEKSVWKVTVITFLLICCWLYTTAIGISSLMSGDILMTIVYIFSGILGKYLAMTVFDRWEWLNRW